MNKYKGLIAFATIYPFIVFGIYNYVMKISIGMALFLYVLILVFFFFTVNKKVK